MRNATFCDVLHETKQTLASAQNELESIFNNTKRLTDFELFWECDMKITYKSKEIRQ